MGTADNGPPLPIPQTADRRDNADEGATMAKATETRSATSAKTATKRTRSAGETEKIRVALDERRRELQSEYHQA